MKRACENGRRAKPCRCARCESGDRVHPRAARDPFAWLRHLPEAEQIDALKASVSDPENIFQVPIVPTTFHAADEPGCVATMALWARCEQARLRLADRPRPDDVPSPAPEPGEPGRERDGDELEAGGDVEGHAILSTEGGGSCVARVPFLDQV